MSDPIVFLTVDQVLAIHRRMIDEFGGVVDLRDRGLLESAVAMPAARFGGAFLHVTIPAMAAAYLFHLCRNHAFVDGNKWVALAAAETFLLLNEHELQADNDELEKLTMGVAQGAVSKDDVARFFSKHTARTDARGESL